MTKGMSLKSNSFVAAAEQYVFGLFLNTDSDEVDATSLGRPFHTFAPATRKARPSSLYVQWVTYYSLGHSVVPPGDPHPDPHESSRPAHQ